MNIRRFKAHIDQYNRDRIRIHLIHVNRLSLVIGSLYYPLMGQKKKSLFNWLLHNDFFYLPEFPF
jgi:hypothetical protein